jgi:hypothetical protein
MKEIIMDRAPAVLLCIGVIALIIGSGIESNGLIGTGLVILISAFVFDSIFNPGYMGPP